MTRNFCWKADTTRMVTQNTTEAIHECVVDTLRENTYRCFQAEGLQFNWVLYNMGQCSIAGMMSVVQVW